MNVINVGGIVVEWNDNEWKKFDVRMVEVFIIVCGWGNDYVVVDDVSCCKVFDVFIELYVCFFVCVVFDLVLIFYDDVGA